MTAILQTLLRTLYSFVLLIVSPFLIALMGLMSYLGLDSCGATGPSEKWVESTFSLQLDGATVEEAWDTHGGFHGDGNTYIQLSLTAGLEEQITAVNAEYAGEKKGGPWYAISEYSHSYASLQENVIDYRGEGEDRAVLPEITNGYFCLIDDFGTKDEYVWIDTDWRMGAYWNWKVAIYDADTLKLYYYESDM